MDIYFAVIAEEFIVCIGRGRRVSPNGVTIEKSRYDAIAKKIKTAPIAPDGYQYKLNADTLEWELVEIPVPEPKEPTAEEIVDILLGGEA